MAPEPLNDRHKFADFSCGKQELDDWLRNLAYYNQVNNYTRTFVVADRKMNVRAYYALCTGMILRKELARNQCKFPSPSEIPVAVLARFAVHKEFQGRRIGMALLANALRNAASAAQVVAFRAVVIDAKDNRAADFYKRLGFKETKISPLKLILPTQDIIVNMNGL